MSISALVWGSYGASDDTNDGVDIIEGGSEGMMIFVINGTDGDAFAAEEGGGFVGEGDDEVGGSSEQSVKNDFAETGAGACDGNLDHLVLVGVDAARMVS